MTTPFQSGPHWSTASFGDTADTSPMELSAQGDHLDLCQGLRGRLFAARCRAEVVHGFIASHLVTTALGVMALVVAGWLVL
ncbi:hypothetical protein [uncultured Sphaerotilus sp.]|uniref:hypothetical protein n=1 Tax=uncultured Sphaerotilus sp. TaxID=474984 RepID=UPI0030CA3E3A